MRSRITSTRLRFLQARHGVACGAHAGQQHTSSTADLICVSGEFGGDAEALECAEQGRYIRATAVDNSNLRHNAPLVDGNSVPLRAIAWRSARPTALKHASTM